MRYLLIVIAAAVIFALIFVLNALRIALSALRRETPADLLERIRSAESFVSTDSISPVFLSVVLAAEDPRFYEHRGFDLKGIKHAVAVNLRERRGREHMRGGSTVTQQLVKNVYLTPEKTFTRKLAELFVSLYVEKKLSKTEILEMYCNIIYYGRGAVGIKAAAEIFFDCLPSELTLNRSVTLVCILPNPDEFDPVVYPEDFVMFREITMQQLLKRGCITEETADLLRKETWDAEAPEIRPVS